MKANVNYNDLIGTVAADTSDSLGPDSLKGLAKHFNINEERFKPIGISLSGPNGFYISILCVDKEKSTNKKEHIVKMNFKDGNNREIIDILFKQMHIVLYDELDKRYSKLDYDEVVNFNDFHETNKK